ncbi:MAG: hypothetical protein PVH11_01135 [Anaerolineae bacterium]
MPDLTTFDLRLTIDDVLRAQGGDPVAIRARRPAFADLAERALDEGLPLLQPRLTQRRLAVQHLLHECLALAGGAVLSGPLVTQHLASASEVVVMLCTIGLDLETRADEVMAEDMLYGLALDGVGSAAVEALAVAACHYVEQQAADQGWRASVPINPGMVGWPVGEGQQQIFNILAAAAKEITLTATGMMIPRKSLSMVLGLGTNVSDGGSSCDYCSMGDRCRYRSPADD